MKVKKIFEMMEAANEFKKLIGEVIKIKINIISNDEVIGTAHTFEQFIEILDKEFHHEAKEGILSAEIQKTTCIKEFRVFYMFAGEPKSIKLFVE